MITALVIASWAVVGTAVARVAYGRMRAEAVRNFGVNWTNSKHPDADDAFWIIAVATTASIPAWPIALIVLAIITNPPKTSEEIKAERDRAVKALEDMERNAGLR